MFSYLVTFILGWLATVICSIANNISKRASSAIVLIPISIMVAIKGGVGTDNINYQLLVQTIADRNLLNYSFEPLFLLLVKALLLLSSNPLVIINIIGLIIILINLIAISNTKKIDLMLFQFTYLPFFLLELSFNTIRFGLATSIFLLGISFYCENKLKLSVLFLFLSTLIHMNTIILIVLTCYFIFDARYYKYLTLLIVLAILISTPNIINKTNFYALNTTYSSATYLGISNFIFILLITVYRLLRRRQFLKIDFYYLIFSMLLVLASSYSQIFLRLNQILAFSCLCVACFKSETYFKINKANFVYTASASLVLIFLKIGSLSKPVPTKTPYTPFTYIWTTNE